MNLRGRRKDKGISQVEVADLLNVSQSTYSKYENGEIEPDISTLKKLAELFQTTIDDLVEFEVPYLIHKSKFSSQQLLLVDKIQALDNNQCLKLLAYIDGLKDGNVNK